MNQRQYTNEFKLEAMRLAERGDVPVAQIARKLGLHETVLRRWTAKFGVKSKHRFVATTESKHNLSVAPSLLNRQFISAGPNRIWASDITYDRTLEGWLYPAVVIDLHSQMVVG